MKLENKVAVVTGATRGIGACMAQRFAAEGATVVVAGRNAERGDLVAKNIVEQGGKGTFVQTDIGVEADVQRLMARTADTFGGVDILVNNAALPVTPPRPVTRHWPTWPPKTSTRSSRSGSTASGTRCAR